MKENTYISTGGGKASEILIALIKNISKAAFDGSLMKVALLTLLIAGGAAKAGAEEVTGTILFEPKLYDYGMWYSLDTNGDMIVDKTMSTSYNQDGGNMNVLSDYLVCGAKIVYENKGMKNETGEWVSSNRTIGIITIDGIYIELTKILRWADIAYFPYLVEKLVREGRAR
jgi:hypothetical protein